MKLEREQNKVENEIDSKIRVKKKKRRGDVIQQYIVNGHAINNLEIPQLEVTEEKSLGILVDV